MECRNLNDPATSLSNLPMTYAELQTATAFSFLRGASHAEELVAVARREFEEETGFLPSGHARPLTPVRQKGGKTVRAWAIEGNWDVKNLVSNKFQMEWPRGSGRSVEFPEIDKASWFSIGEARLKINGAQAALLDELAHILGHHLEGQEHSVSPSPPRAS